MTHDALRAVGAHRVHRHTRPGPLGTGVRNMAAAVTEWRHAKDLGVDARPGDRAKEISRRQGLITARVAAAGLAVWVTALVAAVSVEHGQPGLLASLAWIAASTAVVGWSYKALPATAAVVLPLAVAVGTVAAWNTSPWTPAALIVGVLASALTLLAVIARYSWRDGSLLDDIGVPIPAASGTDLAIVAVASGLGLDVDRHPELAAKLESAAPVTRRDDGGWSTSVRLPLGRRAGEVNRDAVASVLRMIPRRVETTAHPGDVNVVDVLVHGVDPESVPTEHCPLAVDPVRTSVFDPARIGVTTAGQVTVPLIGNSFLLGGQPGYGKSVTAMVILTHALLDPTCEVYVADGKILDTLPLQPVATAWTGDDLDATADMLAAVEVRMRANKEALAGMGLKRITPAAVEAGVHPVVVYVDELNSFLDVKGPGQGAAERIKRSLKRIAEQGRALGVIPLLVTQNPTSRNTPTDLRDIIKTRVAFRTATWQGSNAVLGDGSAGMGWYANELESPGSAILNLQGVYSRPRCDDFDTEADLARVVAAVQAERAAYVPEPRPVPGPVAAVAAVLEDAGVDRMTAAEVAAAMGMDPDVVRDSLRDHGVRTRDIRTAEGTRKGYRLADLVGATVPRHGGRRGGDGGATVIPIAAVSRGRRGGVAGHVAGSEGAQQ